MKQLNDNPPDAGCLDSLYDILYYESSWEDHEFLRQFVTQYPLLKDAINPLVDEWSEYGHNYYLAFPEVLESMTERELETVCDTTPLAIQFIPESKITREMIHLAMERCMIVDELDLLSVVNQILTTEERCDLFRDNGWHLSLDIESYIPEQWRKSSNQERAIQVSFLAQNPPPDSNIVLFDIKKCKTN